MIQAIIGFVLGVVTTLATFMIIAIKGMNEWDEWG